MNIAIIPARGGSKRIPRKNIKSFNGMPMLSWSIKAAKESNLFDHIIVSTDDAEIASVARNFGAETPFERPQNLSDDLTPTVPVIAHAVSQCLNLGLDAENFCCIYPCAPFIRASDMVAAFNILIEENVDFVYPVTDYPHPIQRAMRRLPNSKMNFIQPQHELTRTQDLEQYFHDAGQFYWGKSSSWLDHKKMHTDGLGMPIPHWRVVDIDTEDDWKRAEVVFEVMNRNG